MRWWLTLAFEFVVPLTFTPAILNVIVAIPAF